MDMIMPHLRQDSLQTIREAVNLVGFIFSIKVANQKLKNCFNFSWKFYCLIFFTLKEHFSQKICDHHFYNH